MYDNEKMGNYLINFIDILYYDLYIFLKLIIYIDSKLFKC